MPMSDSSFSFPPIAVLGAGAWGTALALHLARNQQQVKLWVYEKAQLTEINATRYNSRYLPGQRLPAAIFCTDDYKVLFAEIRDVLIALPSVVFRENLLAIKPLLKKGQRLIWATKGIDPKKHQLLHEVVGEIMGEISTAVISGPSFAEEVALNLPTAVTIASQDEKFADELLGRFQGVNFRVELTADVIGVELGGAIKNVIAIGIGIADGLGFGANARAALMTQAMAEIIELGLALGAKRSTFWGLSGIGDLILTCTDNQSRNRRLGMALGHGKTLKQAQKELGTTEGVATAQNIFYLLKKYKLKAPINDAVYRVLYEQQNPEALFKKFFN
jgi:glycerol-3-phosphate dehydrogenase (NAD(P)+)